MKTFNAECIVNSMHVKSKIHESGLMTFRCSAFVCNSNHGYLYFNP